MKTSRTNKAIIMKQMATRQQKIHTIIKPTPMKKGLKDIMEVTEENDGNPTPKLEKHKQEFKQQLRIDYKASFFQKYMGCIRSLCQHLSRKSSKLQLDVNEKDFNEVIMKIKNKKHHSSPVLPPQKQIKKILVLDLDETLIHSTFTKPQSYDFQSEVTFSGTITNIYTVKRFGLDAFLFQMSKLYQIAVFTASQRLYADRMIDLIDPKKRISHRLYRQNCIIINKMYYLKDMNLLGRNINDLVLVDDNYIAGLLQPDNLYKIQPFGGNKKDRELCRLSAFLKHLYVKKNILPIRRQRQQFEDMEIHLSEEDTSTKYESRGGHQKERKHRLSKKFSQIDTFACKTNDSQRQSQAQITGSELIRAF